MVRVHGDTEVAPVTGRIAVHIERVRRLDVKAVTCARPCGALVVLRRERGACRVDQDPAAVELNTAVRLGVEGAAGVAAVERHDRVTVVQRLGPGNAPCAHRVECGLGRNERGLYLARDLNLDVLDVPDVRARDRRPVDRDGGLRGGVGARAGGREQASAAARVAVGERVGTSRGNGLVYRYLLVQH